MLKERSRLIYFILFAVVMILILALIVFAVRGRPVPVAEPEPTPVPSPTPEVIIREKEVEKIVEVEKEISAETICDGLRDMGVLVTEEYFFTDVISFSSIKKLFNIELGVTESSYVAGYDGVVTAGIDFSAVKVRKDAGKRQILVTLPPAEILNVDIDPESFVLYDERIRPWNPISAEDFNSSLVELEAKAREKALSRGILEKAEENARLLVRNMIAGLEGPNGYPVVFTEE